jgi:hypothetical protein
MLGKRSQGPKYLQTKTTQREFELLTSHRKAQEPDTSTTTTEPVSKLIV